MLFFLVFLPLLLTSSAVSVLRFIFLVFPLAVDRGHRCAMTAEIAGRRVLRQASQQTAWLC